MRARWIVLAFAGVALFFSGFVIGRMNRLATAPKSTQNSPQNEAAATSRTKALAVAAPDDFRGAKWGTSESAARQHFFEATEPSRRDLFKYEWQCYDGTYARRCEYNFDFGGNVAATAYLIFLKTGLQAVDLSWGQSKWPFVRDTFHRRFGEPNETGVATLQNAMGATITSHWDRWRWPDRSLTIYEYGSKIDECAGTLATNTYERAIKDMRETASKEAAAKF